MEDEMCGVMPEIRKLIVKARRICDKCNNFVFGFTGIAIKYKFL